MNRIFILSFIMMMMLCSAISLGGSISGVVYNNGNPVEWAVVIAMKVPFDSTFFFTNSDTGGSYLLQNVPAGQYQMSCRYHDASLQDSILVTVSTGSSVEGVNFFFFLSPQVHNSVSGKITNRQLNVPIYGASVRLTDVLGTAIAVQTDVQGQFSFNDVPANRYSLSAFAAGFNGATYPQDILIGSETHLSNVNIALDTLIIYHTAIAGHVYDTVSGKPLAGVNISDGILPFQYDSLHSHWAMTDSNGYYIFSNMIPGTYTLTYDAYGYNQGTRTNVVVVDAETTLVDKYLQPLATGTMAGKVSLANGNPVQGARLEFVSLRWGNAWRTATTGPDGIYTIPLVAGDYFVSCQVDIDGYHLSQWYGGGQPNGMAAVTVSPNQSTSGIDFVIQPPRSLHITMSGLVKTRSGRPIEGAWVSPEYDSVIIHGQGQDQAGAVQTGPDGRYQLELSVTAREYFRFAVSAHHDAFQVQYYRDKPVAWLADYFVLNHDTAITDINFALDSINTGNNSISGTLTTATGRPIRGGYVFAHGIVTFDERMGLTDSAGHYTINDLTNQQYNVAFSAAGFLSEIYDNVQSWEQATPVQVNGPVTGISAILDSAANDSGHSAIVGVVRDQLGNSLPGAIIILKHNQRGVVRSSMTLSDGTYSLDGVKEGQYTLIGSKAGYSTSTETVAILSTSPGTSAMNIALHYQAPSAAVNVPAGWSLVSLPMRVLDGRAGSVFPGFSGLVYRYTNQGYRSSGELTHGTGYWMKNSAIGAYTIAGEAIVAETLQVMKGWNMIGALSVPVPVSSILGMQQGIVTSQFFGFRGGYYGADTLYPGKGYWVKANDAGTLIISLQSSGSLHPITVVRTSENPPAFPGVLQSPEMKPAAFALEQNYPNPFNPSTRIEYNLPEAGKVTLKLYDMLGKEIQTIVNGEQAAGRQTVTVNAGNLSSGIYYYRIQAGKFSDMKKMLLVK